MLTNVVQAQIFWILDLLVTNQAARLTTFGCSTMDECLLKCFSFLRFLGQLKCILGLLFHGELLIISFLILLVKLSFFVL